MKTHKTCVLVIYFACLISPLLAAAKHEALEETVTETLQESDNVTIHVKPRHHSHTIIINGTEVKCGPAAIEEFPRPMVNAEMRAKGGVIVHIATATTMVLIISVLCKEYFVPALHVLINYLEIDPDVAGGTFMAAASSIPALVTSVIGVNVVENDLGLSTTLGSGVLNAAGVLSIAALFAKRTVEIHAWPLYRSSFFFLLCMVIVLCSLMDNQIDWIEATICLVSYIIYGLVMAFNRPLEACFQYVTGIQDLEDPIQAKDNNGSEITTVQSYTQYGDNEMKTFKDNGNIMSNLDASVVKQLEAAMNAHNGGNNLDEPMIDPKAWENLNVPRKIFLVITKPFSFVLSFLIPNCKKPEYEKYYMVTFLLSGGFIAAFSYILVWMMAIIGYTFGIPDSVLGLTFLSISVTLPDIMAAVLVVRKGYGDMAVCYVLGTNIFEVLVGLGLPWFLQTTVFKPGTTVELQSSGLIYSTACVLFTVFLVPALTYATRWKMNNTYGVVLLLWYLIFMVISCMYQMNVFDDSNPPSCGSDY
ncbi:probable sodium/potassium/calcium exchanger CG1090 [Galendromus occidentalis]|uniref:Probable sodium/potassium/calcium exchanger CG1090 n=1 Tax=Galendromus occidentalis TaxID=34638 RepID=A0AAJ6QTR9_9ACAR|nr:probable sodium/potassium/calcium exchanger CG1090 [Galendromus occidentalis]